MKTYRRHLQEVLEDKRYYTEDKKTRNVFWGGVRGTITNIKFYKFPSIKAAYRNSWTLDARVGRWTLDTGLWTLDSGRWTLDAGLWTLDATLRKLGSGH